MGYSLDFRLRVVICITEKKKTWDEVIEFFGICRDSLRRWLAEYRETGTLSAHEKKPYKPQKVDPEALEALIEKEPDATLEDLAQPFDCHPSAIHYRCRQMGITRKKNNALHRKK